MANEESRLLDVEFYIEAAGQHGENSEPGHEVGDLQELLREMWELLTPAQRLQFAQNENVRSTLENTLVEFEDELAKLP